MNARRLGVLLCSAVAGASTMVLELASVRALAPWFGSSTEVWTSAIGVVLLALAAGYALGGVLAERGKPARVLGIALSLAGALTAATPCCVGAVARWFLPEDLGLDHAPAILRNGALFTQGVLFGTPVFFAAFTSPLLIRILTGASTPGGLASGLVLFASTLGALAGTFGTTYWLIPNFGVRATLYGTGLALALVGLGALASDRRNSRLGMALLLVAIGGGAVGLPALHGPLKPGPGLIAEKESREQYLRVVERDGTDGAGLPSRETWLQINEGLDSFQSLDAPDRKTPGHYYDLLAFSTLLAGNPQGKPRVAMIGAGAGSTARALLELVPEAEIDAIELDPDVLDLGRRYFRMGQLEARRSTFHGGVDGRAALRALRGPYDAILIDAYARQVEIPFQLVTEEMMALCLERLADRGIVGINVSSFGREDPVLLAIAETMATAGEKDRGAPARVGILPVRRDHNSIVVLRKGLDLPTPARLLETIRARGSRSAAAVQLAQYVCGPGGLWFYARSDSQRSLTDDCAPMERLQARSLALARKGWD